MNEAENEHMQVMTFVEIARPTAFERLVVLLAQGSFSRVGERAVAPTAHGLQVWMT